MEMKDSREQNTSNRHSEKLCVDVCVDVCVSHICPTAVARCLGLQRPHQSSSIHSQPCVRPGDVLCHVTTNVL